MVKQQHQTLKAVTDGKLLTVNILCQYLGLIETLNFHRKQTNQAVDVSLGTDVEQSMLFQMAFKKHKQSLLKISTYFTFSEFQEEIDFWSSDLLAVKFIMLLISLNCYIHAELHTIYRIKIHQIVLELQAFV